MKYSEIAETPLQNVEHLQKPMDMCNITQNHVPASRQQNYASQYHPESQYQQYPMGKYPQCRKYPPQENDFLAKLQRINPTMARSIMSDHHIRESQTAYPQMYQNQRYYNPAYNYQYNYPSCNYRPNQMPVGGAQYPTHSDRSLSPRNIMMNYSNSQKISPNYGQYNPPEYAQHYQHRRTTIPQEYYQQQCRTAPYMPTHQISPETSENRSGSGGLRHFIENWAEEEGNSEITPIFKDTRIHNNETNNEQVFVINPSDLPPCLENVSLVPTENGQYIIKSGTLDNSVVRIKETTENNGEKTVNLQIVETPPKTDCLLDEIDKTQETVPYKENQTKDCDETTKTTNQPIEEDEEKQEEKKEETSAETSVIVSNEVSVIKDMPIIDEEHSNEKEVTPPADITDLLDESHVTTTTKRTQRIFSVDDIINNIGNSPTPTRRSSLQLPLKVGDDDTPEETPNEEKEESEEVELRDAITVEDNSVILEIGGALVQLNINDCNGKKILTVLPLSESLVIDVNGNYEEKVEDDEEIEEIQCQNEVVVGEENVVNEEVCLDLVVEEDLEDKKESENVEEIIEDNQLENNVEVEEETQIKKVEVLEETQTKTLGDEEEMQVKKVVNEENGLLEKCEKNVTKTTEETYMKKREEKSKNNVGNEEEMQVKTVLNEDDSQLEKYEKKIIKDTEDTHIKKREEKTKKCEKKVTSEEEKKCEKKINSEEKIDDKLKKHEMKLKVEENNKLKKYERKTIVIEGSQVKKLATEETSSKLKKHEKKLSIEKDSKEKKNERKTSIQGQVEKPSDEELKKQEKKLNTEDAKLKKTERKTSIEDQTEKLINTELKKHDKKSNVDDTKLKKKERKTSIEEQMNTELKKPEKKTNVDNTKLKKNERKTSNVEEPKKDERNEEPKEEIKVTKHVPDSNVSSEEDMEKKEISQSCKSKKEKKLSPCVIIEDEELKKKKIATEAELKNPLIDEKIREEILEECARLTEDVSKKPEEPKEIEKPVTKAAKKLYESDISLVKKSKSDQKQKEAKKTGSKLEETVNKIKSLKEKTIVKKEKSPKKVTFNLETDVREISKEEIDRKKLSWEEYNSRKRKAPPEPEEPKNKIMEDTVTSSVDINDEVVEKVAQSIEDAIKLKKPSPKMTSSNWEDDTEAETPPKNEEISTTNHKCIIDVNEFNIKPMETVSTPSPVSSSHFSYNSEEDSLQVYKNVVDSKLNSLNIKIPKISKSPKPVDRFTVLLERFLNRASLNLNELEEVKKFIELKRKIIEEKKLTYEVKAEREYKDLKLHFRKVRKKKRFRNLYTEDTSDSDSSHSEQGVGDYSVYQRDSQGVPKLIFKRKSGLPQPFVKLERSQAVEMLAKKRKLY